MRAIHPLQKEHAAVPNVSRATLVGYADRGPEIRTSPPSGDRAARFTLATTERFRRKDGKTGESTRRHRIAAFGAAAETAERRVRKGAPLRVEGRIERRTCEDPASGASQRSWSQAPGTWSTRSPDAGTMRPVLRPTALLAAALALMLAAVPAAAEETGGEAALEAGCDPVVREALARSARVGVEADVAIVRHPQQGIRNPDSILDLSCLEDLFDFRTFDILFDPGRYMTELLGLVQRRICAVARQTYRDYVGRPLDAAVYTVTPPPLPGLYVTPQYGNVLRGDVGSFRAVVGGEP